MDCILPDPANLMECVKIIHEYTKYDFQ